MSCKLQRFPLDCITEVHFMSGKRINDKILDPLILALPHSVSTVTTFRSVAPVMESPFLKMIVVDGSSAEASLIPATSDNMISTSPNAPRNGNFAISMRAPVIFWPPCSSTVTVNGPALATDATGARTAVAVASRLLSGQERTARTKSNQSKED